jgi:biotin-[acetyl-CoA-carboxylase] ligase BirA-like protein
MIANGRLLGEARTGRMVSKAMIVITDDIPYANSILEIRGDWGEAALSDPELDPLIEGLFTRGPLSVANADGGNRWSHAFIVKDAAASQFDLLVELCQKGVSIPDGVICIAGMGQSFHGQRGRPWSAHPGNIHLSIFFSPQAAIRRFHIGFSILAAVSIVGAIDQLETVRGRAGIKWVNDVLIDGAKVAGFLAHTASVESIVRSAVLGIGLNVEASPRVHADVFVPRVGALCDFVPDRGTCNRKAVLELLLRALADNYDSLLAGRFEDLLDAYRERSLVIGKNVRILSDAIGDRMSEIGAGRVASIGDNLELHLEGSPEPIRTGRLILED